MLLKVLRLLGIIFLCLLLLIFILTAYASFVSKTPIPVNSSAITQQYSRTERDNGLFYYGNSWMRKSESGLYELYAEGNPLERGIAIGELSKELLYFQETVFAKQLKLFVPQEYYMQIIKYFVAWFNRYIDDLTPQENKEEIYGISLAASHDFDYIAPPYQRLLNYHGAHDLGHALQNMALVGCSSFAIWDQYSDSTPLWVGRNFDFFVGHEFAKNKIIHFIKPDSGYRFMHISFAGMTGVLSGMNEKGLTVSINAAKSRIPSSSATPVSIVARQVLQYASTIHEALQIIRRYKLFVAETFLVSSSTDLDAAIIEADLDTTLLYRQSSPLISTNHFQSEYFLSKPMHAEHALKSASVPRMQRLEQLLTLKRSWSAEQIAEVLRDKKGIDGKQLGLGNEKAVDQLIAHHSVIFDPTHLLVWISTAPYTLGKYVCYYLPDAFDKKPEHNSDWHCKDKDIGADAFLQTTEFSNFEKYNQFRYSFQDRTTINVDSMIHWNPNCYQPYVIAGDQYFHAGNAGKAKEYYNFALVKGTSSEYETEYINKQLYKLNKKW